MKELKKKNVEELYIHNRITFQREKKKYMMQFSTEELKEFLGNDIVDSLLEWDTGNEAFASKKRLSEIILCVHGLSILKNSSSFANGW